MDVGELDKNVNYPSLDAVLIFLKKSSEYFSGLKLKGVKGIKDLKKLTPQQVSELKQVLNLVTKAEAIIYQEIDIMRSSVLSKKDLAKAMGIPHATFFRSLKKRNFTPERLRAICMLLIDPNLKKEFTFVEEIRKFIEDKPKDRHTLLWAYFISTYFDGEQSPFYKIDLKNIDQVVAAYETLITQPESAPSQFKEESPRDRLRNNTS